MAYYIARRSIRELPDTIGRLTKRLDDLTADQTTLAAHERDPIHLGREYASEDLPKALGRQLDRLPAEVRETRPFPIGTFRGLAFGVVLYRFGAPEVYLEGAAKRHGPLARDAGPRAVLNALDRLAESYTRQCDAAAQDLAIAEGQLRDH